MRPGALAGAIAAILSGICSPALADRQDEPIGRWLTQDRGGVIEILPCAMRPGGGPGLCGRVVGMDEPFDAAGRPVVDSTGQRQCGLWILDGARESQDGLWRGTILNPNDGSRWRCEVWMTGQTLHLRGYVVVPLLGRTQVWTRYTGPLGRDCRIG